MLQRPPASGPSSSHPHEETRSIPAPTQGGLGPSASGSGGQEESKPTTGPGSTTGDPVTAAQEHWSPTTSRSRQQESRPTRSLGVHNILNPQHAEPREISSSQLLSRSQSVAQLRSPPRSLPVQLPDVPQQGRWPATGSPSAGISPVEPYGVSSAQPPRRILTPKSPYRRAASLGRVSLPGTISAQQSPFLPVGPKSYPTDPGSAELPRIPTSPGVPKYSFPYPYAGGRVPSPRRVSGGGPGQRSQAASPSTSYSSYSQPGHPSPTPQYGMPPAAHGPTSSMYPFPPPAELGPSPIVFAPEGSYGPPLTGSSQSSYQLMTLDTDQGPIQVPVDVQAASKVADEKRKRNAGASARFRQRRKEKEREASTTISKLEQQNRDVAEEADFYRRERDYFRDIVYSTPAAAARAVPRPVSPRGRRPIAQRPSTSAYGQTQEVGGGVERNTRRRTDDYPSSFSLPPPTTPGGPLPSHYGPPSIVPPSRQPPTSEHHSAAGTVTLPPPPLPRTESYHPPPRTESYDRSWPPTR